MRTVVAVIKIEKWINIALILQVKIKVSQSWSHLHMACQCRKLNPSFIIRYVLVPAVACYWCLEEAPREKPTVVAAAGTAVPLLISSADGAQEHWL